MSEKQKFWVPVSEPCIDGIYLLVNFGAEGNQSAFVLANKAEFPKYFRFWRSRIPVGQMADDQYFASGYIREAI